MATRLVIKYDRAADALYIRLREGRVAESEEVEPGIIVDYGEDGEIVGIEVLEFSKRRRVDLTRLVVEGPESLLVAQG